MITRAYIGFGVFVGAILTGGITGIVFVTIRLL